MSPPSPRNGIIAGGNFIVDAIMRIDRFPQEEMLANILDEARSNGGGPYNVLRDLAALGADYPLSAIGMVGADENGRWIREDCRAHGIKVDQLHETRSAATSHTLVMTVGATGRRTFFHHRGANRLLEPQHFGFSQGTRARLFHLGYLMLLDGLDAFDAEGRTGASRVLEAACAAGLKTSVDLVSVDHPDFRSSVTQSFPWIDHLIINEVETSRLLQRTLDAEDPAGLQQAAEDLLRAGVREAVVIHTIAGGVLASRCEGVAMLGSVLLPDDRRQGANGAGDAFAAGYLHALHAGQPAIERLRLAVCTAAASLADPSPSAGVQPADDCLGLGARFGYRPLSPPKVHAL